MIRVARDKLRVDIKNSAHYWNCRLRFRGRIPKSSKLHGTRMADKQNRVRINPGKEHLPWRRSKVEFIIFAKAIGCW